MNFGCSVCEYISTKKANVERHINRKQICGPGIKEVIEIPVDIRCEFCNKKFTTSSNLTRHQKDNCKTKVEILEKQLKEANKRDLEKQLKEKPVIINNNNNNNT